MKYRDIEIEWMKELLKENEVEIARLRKELRETRKKAIKVSKRLERYLWKYEYWCELTEEDKKKEWLF